MRTAFVISLNVKLLYNQQIRLFLDYLNSFVPVILQLVLNGGYTLNDKNKKKRKKEEIKKQLVHPKLIAPTYTH